MTKAFKKNRQKFQSVFSGISSGRYHMAFTRGRMIFPIINNASTENRWPNVVLMLRRGWSWLFFVNISRHNIYLVIIKLLQTTYFRVYPGMSGLRKSAITNTNSILNLNTIWKFQNPRYLTWLNELSCMIKLEKHENQTFAESAHLPVFTLLSSFLSLVLPHVVNHAFTTRCDKIALLTIRDQTCPPHMCAYIYRSKHSTLLFSSKQT